MTAAGATTAHGVQDVGDTGPRRWPWAMLAATLGAAGGAAAAVLVRRRIRPDAQEPHELRAVVDRPARDAPR